MTITYYMGSGWSSKPITREAILAHFDECQMECHELIVNKVGKRWHWSAVLSNPEPQQPDSSRLTFWMGAALVGASAAFVIFGGLTFWRVLC